MSDKTSSAADFGLLEELEALIERVKQCRRTAKGASSLQLLGLHADLIAALDGAHKRCNR